MPKKAKQCQTKKKKKSGVVNELKNKKGQYSSQGYVASLLENSLWLHLERGGRTRGRQGSGRTPHTVSQRAVQLPGNTSKLLDQAFLHHFSSMSSSSGHLPYLPLEENTWQALRQGQGVCGHKLEKSCLSQVTVPNVTPTLFGGLTQPYLKGFSVSFFFFFSMENL